MLTFERAAATLPVADRWVLDLFVENDDGDMVDDAPTVVVTLPELVTAPAAVSRLDVGRYRAVYVPATPGRYLATATTTSSGVAAVSAVALASTSAGGMPDAAAYVAYAGPSSWTTAQIDDALAAETAAQAAVCRVGAYLVPDLRNALLRRVQRNLAMRRIPLAMQTGDADTGGPAVPPGRDPEIRRLEAPYRKLTIG